MDHRPKHKNKTGISLAVQWLKLHTSNTRGVGLIPGQGTKILRVKHGADRKKTTNKKTRIHPLWKTIWHFLKKFIIKVII